MSRLAPSRGRWTALAVSAIAASLAAAPALARDPSASERAGLTEMLDRFATATRDGDGAVVAATLPPRVVAVIAAQRGADAEAELKAIAGQIAAIKQAGLRKTVTFDLDHVAIDGLKDGTPYAVIPMHDVADGPKHLDFTTKALAFRRDGTWYLLALGPPERLAWLKAAYPAFDGVVLDAPTEAKP